MQLIKLNTGLTENRSQEIGDITRELKLLAKCIKSPILLLSQLNRNIENRTNKRPLLSDLRESGCLSYINTPLIKRASKNKLTQVVFYSTECYALKTMHKYELLCGHKDQYTYVVRSKQQSFLCTTHNHKILTGRGWEKEDQIKQKSLHCKGHNDEIYARITKKLDVFKNVKLLYREKVYDITLPEYSNFLINRCIIHNSIEQDADLILMLYKNSEETSNNKIDIVIAKHRNGPIGSFQLLFHAETCKFNNVKPPGLADI